MKRVVCGLLVALALFSGAAAAQEPARDYKGLYKPMYDAGMITQEEYEFALKNGSLPGEGSEGVTAATGEQTTGGAKGRAAYKKQTYAARKEEMRKQLPGLVGQLESDFRAKRQKAERAAALYGLPIREESAKGVRELMAFENGRPMYFGTHNQNAARTIAADRVWPSGTNGLALTGSPITLGIWDAGAVDYRHVEFLENGVTRVQQKDGASSMHWHSTGVAGTMMATGYSQLAHGMSYRAHLDAYDWNNNLAEVALAAISNELRVSNHSYGYTHGWVSNATLNVWEWMGNIWIKTNEDLEFGRYAGEATNLDRVAFFAPYHLMVYSAGNDRSEGPTTQPVNHRIWSGTAWVYTNMVHDLDGGVSGFDTAGQLAGAKNILTVGAVNDITNGYLTTQDVVMTSFSCFGPTDDGRIKPDVVANGVALRSPLSVNPPYHYYADFTGTSQAAPNTSGGLGLLAELQSLLYGTNQPWLASTLKALVIHTADEAGNYPGPDYRFGWGLVNILRAAQLMTNNAAWNSKPHVKEVRLPNADSILFRVMARTNQPLKVTIAWTDLPGPAQPYALDPTNSVLVNDLDLRVVGPSGTTNFPWVLNPTNPAGAATTGNNSRDNVEQVFISNPTNGWYNVSVTHKGTLGNGYQDVSIIVSGNAPTNSAELAVWEYAQTTTATHQVSWPSVVGSLYQIETMNDLMGTNFWSARSDELGATKEELLWEETNTEAVLNFFRVKEIQ